MLGEMDFATVRFCSKITRPRLINTSAHLEAQICQNKLLIQEENMSRIASISFSVFERKTL